MRRIAFLHCLALLFAVVLHAQKVDKEGKAWLDRNNEPAEVNVSGIWFSEDWGNATLEQAQGSREITGDADHWKVKGVVSGKRVFLLFSGLNYKVQYSAELVAEQEDTLKGSYSNGLMKKSPGKEEMLLIKKSSDVVLPVSGGPTATVVVYRRGGFALVSKATDPPVYLDGRQLVWMDNGRYFSFKVSPGAHAISSENEEEPVNIDAGDGETYYIEVQLWGDWGRYGKVKLVSQEKGLKDLKKMKPLSPDRVVAESIVLLEPISTQ